jgi:hypothetical protein
MRIVGIDSGSRRLAVSIWDGEWDLAWYETPPTSTETEIEDLCWWLTGVAGVTRKDAVYLEPVVVGVRGGVQTAVRHALTVGGVVATVGGTLVQPATWKASILGYGSADKNDYSEWVQDTSPEVAARIQELASTKPRRQDLYAAHCIAHHGHLARRHPDQLGQGRGVQARRHRP